MTDRDRPVIITAYGTPATQGSKRHVGKGIMVEASTRTRPWRETVKYAALEAMDGRHRIETPVTVTAIFAFDRPRAHYRSVVRAGLIQVPEGRKIFPNLTVRENLELGSFTRARERRVSNLERMFAVFPRLKERAMQKAGSMSGGEQQMLAIGRGLMAEPKLLILDEPSLGLSPLLVEELFALVSRLNADGLSVLLVEQNVAQSLEIAHRACVLENGSVRFTGLPAELLASPALKRAYLGLS